MSVELDEVRGFLAQHEPFSRLTGPVLDELSAALRIRYARRGEELVAAGANNDTLFIIRSGAVDVIDPDGLLLDRREAGFACGYSSLVSGSLSHFSLEAVEDSLLFELDRPGFLALIEENPAVERFYSAQSRQVRAAAKELVDDAPTDVLRTKISELLGEPALQATPETSIREAATLMAERGVSSLLIAQGTSLQGIITDRDLRARVLAAGVDPATPVSEIMTPHPVTVASDAPAMEALLHMAQMPIHHLPVVDSGKLAGIISQSDITRLLHNDPIYLTADFSRRSSPAALEGAYGEAATLAARYVERGSSPQEAASMLTLAADALGRRLCTLAEEELGPPPVPYAFVAVGSQGRREMAMASDQDNALVLDDSYDEAAHGEYFAQLSEYVCSGLAGAGQVLCPGEMMAMVPRWRMTVSDWKATFHDWIAAPEPDALLNAQIFFDMRSIFGAQQLVSEVHSYAVSAARPARRLHAHLASLAARREPPLTFFRGLVVERDGDYADTLDIKKGGTAGIVQMARLFALAGGMEAVDTRERLRQSAGDTVSAQGARDLEDAFDFLTFIGLRHQAAQLRAGEAPDYHISPKSLTKLERERLRDAFRAIKSMQSALATKYPVRNI